MIECNLWKPPLSIRPVGQVNRSLSGLQILATSEATFYQIFWESQLRGDRGAWRLRGGGRGEGDSRLLVPGHFDYFPSLTI